MTVRVNKQPFNIREKLSELERPIGVKGSELMKSETVQEARDLVSAGRKNLIINGAMQVWQRGTSLTGLSNGSNVFLADRWKYSEGGTMSAVVTMSQESDVPTGQGFGYSLKVSPTTADAAIDANEQQVFVYQIEARDLLQLGYGTSNAKASTLSFWVKSSQAGTATIWCLVPSGQSCTLQYKIHKSGTWQKIILTVPANTLGTTPNSNASGLTLYWNIAAGTNFTGTGGNDGFWGAQTNTGRAIGQTVNYLKTTSDYFQITGIQLEVGKNATEFEHRSYGEELLLCQRYFYKLGGEVSSPYSNGLVLPLHQSSNGYYFVSGMFPVEMRTSPTISKNFGTSDYTTSTPSSGNQWNLRDWYVTNRSLGTADFAPERYGRMWTFKLGTVSGGTTASVLYIGTNSNAHFQFNAEL